MSDSTEKPDYNPGLIHYKYGNGDGKSTSAFGMVIRALGHGFKPIIIQFLKKSIDRPGSNGLLENLHKLDFNVDDLIDKYLIPTSGDSENIAQSSVGDQSHGISQKGFDYGEYRTFNKVLEIPIIQLGTPNFVFSHQKPTDFELRRYKLGTALIKRLFSSDTADLVVLDEINTAIALNLIEKTAFIRILENKKEQIEVVMTGREEIPELIDMADYVTEFKEKKHPFQKKIYARKGAEY